MKSRIASKTERALISKSLVFTPTTTITNKSFQITFAPSLSSKPAGQLKSKATSHFDPFNDPEPDLIIDDNLTPSHRLLLNKFCVRKGHVIIATRDFKSQFRALDHLDFNACMSFSKLCSGYLFFYNCGPESGASVLHKHIQAIPIDDLPIDDWINNSNIPFLYEFKSLTTTSPHEMEETFLQMLRTALKQTGQPTADNFTELDSMARPTEFLSYNVIFTLEWMMIVPRRCDGDGNVSVNSLGFVGMILVKRESDLERLKTENGPMELLKAVTFPKS